jgi:hypothetical protein
VPPDREQPRRTANRILAPAVFALIALATLAAFAYAQRLKREPLILDKVTFSPPPGEKLVGGETVITPNGDGRGEFARVRFRLTHSDPGVAQIIDKNDRPVRAFTVKILSAKGRVTAKLPPGSELPAFKDFGFRWNGRIGGGRRAPTGPYRLRVRLLDEDRTLVPGGRIRVHTLRRVSASGNGD